MGLGLLQNSHHSTTTYKKVIMSNLTMADLNVRQLVWSDIRETIQTTNPTLYDIIEAISPSDDYTFIQCNYQYGDRILDNGTVCLPTHSGETLRLDSQEIPTSLKKQLSYSVTPLIIQFSGVSEVFFDSTIRTIPLNIFNPGDLFGLPEALVPLTTCPVFPPWSVTAGARSVFMLPKISDTNRHNRLKAEFNVSTLPPKNLVDQWQTFKEIARNSGQKKTWRSRVLLFTGKWLEDRNDDIHWLLFQKHLFKSAWIESRHWRSQPETNALWEQFAQSIGRRNLKPSTYLIDTIKHLFTLSFCALAAFRPISHNDISLPAQLIEQAYLNVYDINSAPTIMHPFRLGERESKLPIYYSMAHPTLLQGTTFISQRMSIINELRECKRLMEMLEQALSDRPEKVYNTVRNVRYTYFHGEEDPFGEITNSTIIANEDEMIKQSLEYRFQGKPFANHAKFLKGCIRIHKP